MWKKRKDTPQGTKSTVEKKESILTATNLDASNPNV